MVDNVLDMSVVEELLALVDDGDPELLVDLIQLFLDDSPSKVRAITEGLAENDLDKIERAAHSLKGSSGNLGAVLLQETCDRMQLASRRHETAAVRLLVPAVVANYSATETALRQLLTSYSA